MPADDFPRKPPAGGHPVNKPPTAIFDLGFAATADPQLTQGMDIAQQVAIGLRGKIADAVVTGVADAAATADILAAKLHDSMRQDLGTAAQTLLSLHNPILTDLAGSMGQVMEGALPLGVVPPDPQNLGVMPSIVQIRAAALNGDLGPAFTAYNELALPFASVGGLQYAQAMQSVVDALPPDPQIHQAFAWGAGKLAQQSAAAPIGLGNVGNCISNVNSAAFQALAQCAANNKLGGQGYADCASQIFMQMQVAGAQCSGQGAPIVGAPSAGHSGPAGGAAPHGSSSSTSASAGHPSTPPVVPPQPATPPAAPAGGVSGSVFTVPVSHGAPPQFIQSLPGYAALHPGVIYTPTFLQSGPGVSSPGWYLTAPGQFPMGVVVASGPGPGVIDTTLAWGAPQPAATSYTTETSGSAGSGAGGAGSGSGGSSAGSTTTSSCNLDQIRGDAQQVYSATGQGDTALAVVLGSQGVQKALWQRREYPCDSGYQFLGLDTSGGDSYGYDICVKCYPATTTSCGSTTVQQCGPVTVNVACPPPPSPPPVPPVPSKPTPGQTPPSSPPWTAPTNAVAFPGCSEFGPLPALEMPVDGQAFSKAMGLRDRNGNLNANFAGAETFALPKWILETIVGSLAGWIDAWSASTGRLMSSEVCTDEAQEKLIMIGMLTNLAQRFFGDATKYVGEPNRQQRDYRCPVELPSESEAATAWLGNTIDDATLECWVRAAGHRFPEFKTVVDASRTKFAALQIGSLYLRGTINDAQFAARIRELGMTQDSDVADLKELLKQIPPPTDLVRFMVRDTADEALVKRFGMDTDFAIKYGDKIKEWSKQSGISDEYMQSVWRAHWSIPAPTQLYEMLHRSASLPPGDPAVVTLDDVKTALEQQDILPFWVDKFLNISYRPLTRIDAKRAYQIGAIDGDRLKQSYTDLGYNSDTADTLVEFNRRNVRIAYLKSPTVRQYAAGTLSTHEFSERMQDEGADNDTILAAQNRGIAIANQNRRKQCIAAYHKRYVQGDIDPGTSVSMLTNLGLDVAVATQINEGWKCEVASKGKALLASDIAKLYEIGAIDAPDVVRRLQRVGYKYEDAVLLGRKLQYINQQKISKDEAKAIKAQEAEANRQQRSAYQQAQRAQRLIDKQNRALVSMQRVNVMREKRLIEAGRGLEKHQSIPLGDAVVQAKSVYRGWLNTSTYLPDEIIAAIVTVSQDTKTTTAADFAAAVAKILQA